jgi:predicted NAD/FAD-binding protein
MIANFIAFLKELRIQPVRTEMTFGVCRDRGEFEWSGTNLNSVFAQRKNLLSPRFWRMIFDIVRFNQFALDLLANEDSTDDSFGEQSIGDYLEKEGYSQGFREDYLIPMTACVWSTGADKCALEFPATTLVRFLWNHHLLNTVAKRPDWMTIPGGSKRYIDAVMQSLPTSREHLSTRVSSVRSVSDGRVLLTTEDGTETVFDDIILACHGDEAMRIIESSATVVERKILGSFQTTPNIAYLHADLSVSLPNINSITTTCVLYSQTDHSYCPPAVQPGPPGTT